MLVVADEIGAVADVVAAVFSRLHVDEFLAHDARRADGHMRALGDAHIGLHAQRHRDAAAIIRDVCDLADWHACEADLRLLLEADDLMETRVDHVAPPRFQRETGEAEHEHDEQHEACGREGPDLRFCLHAPSPFVVRSVRKNACTRGSWSS